MDEVLRDLVVVALIGAVVFYAATEYVYWRFGFDKIVKHLASIDASERTRAAAVDRLTSSRYERKSA